MSLRFTFREQPLRIKDAKRANPQALGEMIWKLTAANKGRLQREHLVEAAKNPRNPAHRHIEWDDKIAAHAHRLEQAGELIRLVIRDSDKADEPARRAFISIHDSAGTSYRTVDEVLTNQDLQLRVMQQAGRDLAAWESRYQELIEICEMVRVAREALKEKQERAALQTGKEKEARAQ